MTKTDWWYESWKNQSCKATSGLLWRWRWGISMVDRDRWWKSGPSLRSREQNSLWDTAAKHHQCQKNSKPNALMQKSCDCILELWWCCGQWLPEKRCYTELRTLHWNPKKNLKTHTTKEAEFFSWLSVCQPTDSQLKKQNTYQLLYIYSIPSDDGRQICPKHVQIDWQNKLRTNSASSWFLLHR